MTQSGLKPRCLFCRIDDETVNTIVDQSANFYVRWDNFPATDGHVEIVSRRHVRSFFELTPDEQHEACDLMSRVQLELQSKYQPDAYTVSINDGKAAGQTVDHLHIHLIPRYQGDVEDPRGGIRQVLPNFHPERWSQAV